MTEKTFEDLGLSKEILKALHKLKHKNPTFVQEKAFHPIINGKHVLAVAETGSGKTAAFTLPFLERLQRSVRKRQGILIVEPTRELAEQVHKMISSYSLFMDIEIVSIYGGQAVTDSLKDMPEKPTVIIATPGQLISALDIDSKLIGRTQYFVLDEADTLLEKGFFKDLKKILYFLPRDVQMAFFTSTANMQVERQAKKIVHHEIEKIILNSEKANFAKPADTIEQYIQYLEKEDKYRFFSEFIKKEDIHSCIVFARTQARAEKLFKRLKEKEIPASLIHGGKTAGIRDKALKSFRAGETKFLIATDLAARGIDIPALSHVINYDIGREVKSYVHRIGRTGRAGKKGFALSLICEEEHYHMEAIQKLIRIRIPLYEAEGWDNKAPENQRIPLNLDKKRAVDKVRAKKTFIKEKVKPLKGAVFKDKDKKHSISEYKKYKSQKKLEKKNRKG